MSYSVRRTVLALALAAFLAAAARPVTAHDFASRPPRAPVAPVSGLSGISGASGALDRAWSWLHQVWLEASALAAPLSSSPPSPPPCGSDPSCKSTDEGPIIDPNGHH